jgi:hypothetical protein
MPNQAYFAVVLIAAVGGCITPRAPQSAIVGDECYVLVYSDAVGDVSPELLPSTVVLHPGRDHGGVDSQASPNDSIGFWRMFMPAAAWKRLPSDSLSLDFSNGFSSVELVVAHDGRRLEGMSTIYYDVKRPGPKPRMRVHGLRVDCRGEVTTSHRAAYAPNIRFQGNKGRA